MQCPNCEGTGKVVVKLEYVSELVGWKDVKGHCRECEGTGVKPEAEDE